MGAPGTPSTRAALPRRRRGAPSVLDPDWLLQRHLHRDVRAALAAHARGRVLDLGCGERPYAEDFPPGVRVVGLDLPYPGVRAEVCGAAAALPFRGATFDAVFCTQVLEHVPDPFALVAEAARVLRPGGHLVLSAPQQWFLHEAPHDYFRFTRFGLVALCGRAGLSVIEHREQGGFFAVAGISLAAHLGSYLRESSHGAETSRQTPGAAAPRERPWFAALRLPLAAANLVFGALDALPQPGLFAVNHLLVAAKPGGVAAAAPRRGDA